MVDSKVSILHDLEPVYEALLHPISMIDGMAMTQKSNLNLT